MATDWLHWHAEYDDPGSSLSRRLTVVQRFLRAALAGLPSERPVRLLSLCAGDGRDVLPVLAEHARPVPTLLVELDEHLAAEARRSVELFGLAEVQVRVADAGLTASYRDHLPVDVLMLCGVFGNIAPEAARRTIAALPAWLAPEAVVIWTRGRGDEQADAGAQVRSWFAAEGFTELGYVAPRDARFRVGMARRPTGPALRLPDEQRLFEFVR